MNSEQHKQFLTKYALERGAYAEFAAQLETILGRAASLYAPLAVIQTRAKSLSSFSEKAVRKGDKYRDPLRQMTDLCGARVIVHTLEEVDRICEFIKANFEIDETNSLDLRTRLSASEFGYLSVHYVVSPKRAEILGVPIPPGIRDRKAEIQVRTILQHAWADISHDRIYKSTFKIPERWIRESARLAAVLENADAAFARLTSVMDDLAAHYGALLTQDEFEQETDILKTVLANEPDPENRPRIALRLARLFAASEQWSRAITVLEEYVDNQASVLPQMQSELGRAYCEAHRGLPDHELFRRGTLLLRAAAERQADPLRPSGEDANSLRAASLSYLAKSYRYADNPATDIRDVLLEAHRLHPANPYYFAAFIESDIIARGDTASLPLLGNAIGAAIRTCQEHIEFGLELPEAFFTIGKLRILLHQPYQALSAYAKAVDVSRSGKNRVSRAKLQDEIERLQSLQTYLPRSEALEWALRFLHVAVKAFCDAPQNEGTSTATSLPVVYLAGSLQPPAGYSDNFYREMLAAVFHKYDGLLITPVAIPPEHLGKHPVRKCDGTVPEILSILAELVDSGNAVAKVPVICIGGDANAAAACHVALALGATVGAVASSGGAASNLMHDDDWHDHDRLLALPHDRMTLWAFINASGKSPWTAAQLEAAARSVHEHYLQMRTEGQPELSLVPWSFLDESLKESNRQQVLNMSQALAYAGVITDFGRPSTSVPELTPAQVELVAELEHGRWNVERLKDGWRPGPKKDIAGKISPYLVGWKDLPEQIKDYDRNAARQFPAIVSASGLEITYPVPHT